SRAASIVSAFSPTRADAVGAAARPSSAPESRRRAVCCAMCCRRRDHSRPAPTAGPTARGTPRRGGRGAPWTCCVPTTAAAGRRPCGAGEGPGRGVDVRRGDDGDAGGRAAIAELAAACGIERGVIEDHRGLVLPPRRGDRLALEPPEIGGLVIQGAGHGGPPD